MTIGTGTFLPSPGFHFPRSYVYLLDFPTYGYHYTHGGPTWELNAPPPDLTFVRITANPLWYPWVSSYFPLSSILTELYYKLNGVGPNIPLDYTLGYRIEPTTGKPSLYLDWAGIARLPVLFPLPPQPSSYWLPKPFG